MRIDLYGDTKGNVYSFDYFGPGTARLVQTNEDTGKERFLTHSDKLDYMGRPLDARKAVPFTLINLIDAGCTLSDLEDQIVDEWIRNDPEPDQIIEPWLEESEKE